MAELSFPGCFDSKDSFYAILSKMADVHHRKAKDYGSKKRGDTLINFRAGVPYGVEAWKYAICRTAEKMVRIQSFIENGDLANEGMEETLIDCANLLILALQLFREVNPPMFVPEPVKGDGQIADKAMENW